MFKKHNREHFFKYFTADTAKKVLSNRTLKWSTPSLFNDPFDNQFNFLIHDDTELMADQSLNHFMSAISSDKPVTSYTDPNMNVMMEVLRKVTKEQGFNPSESDMQLLKKDAFVGAKNAAARAPEINDFIKKLLSDTSIFCLTETHDNLLMWSHYADNHNGVVLQLRPSHNDSYLTIAQPVEYSNDIPKFTANDFLGNTNPAQKIITTLTLTKSTHWSYEKEWRVITGLRDKSQSYELIPFDKKEIYAIYLGCNIHRNDKDEIIKLSKYLYSQAKIFQAEKHKTQFALIFNQLCLSH